MQLRDEISADEITLLPTMVNFDEEIGRFSHTGFKAGGCFPIGKDALKEGGFSVLVAGKRFGKGSSSAFRLITAFRSKSWWRAAKRSQHASCRKAVCCGPGVSSVKEVVTNSAINRNFPGRSGPGQVWLASPPTVAVSAIAGEFISFAELKQRFETPEH